jgi:magnesium-transporting ATPase (P-type)
MQMVNSSNKNDSNDLSNSDDWQQLSTVWQSQQADDELSNDSETKVNIHLKNIHKKERRDKWEFVIDIMIAGLFLGLALATTVEFFSFHPAWPLWPNEDIVNKVRNGITGESMGYDFVVTNYLFYYLTILICLSLASLIMWRSYKIRQVYKNDKAIGTANPSVWFSKYYKHKIALCKTGKLVGLSLAIFFITLFIITSSLRECLFSASLYESFLRFNLVIVLPLSIYLAALWQEKKFKQLQSKSLSLL